MGIRPQLIGRSFCFPPEFSGLTFCALPNPSCNWTFLYLVPEERTKYCYPWVWAQRSHWHFKSFSHFFSPLSLRRAQRSHILLCPPVPWCGLHLNPQHWCWKGKSRHLLVFALFRVKKNVLHWSNTFIDYINSFVRHRYVSLLCSWCLLKQPQTHRRKVVGLDVLLIFWFYTFQLPCGKMLGIMLNDF